MKIKFPAMILCAALSIAAVGAPVRGQANVQAFWKSFKAAIAKSDKNAAARMTRFPLAMSYGVKSVRNKADFLKRYDEIFNGEADAARCFAAGKLEKENAKSYSIYCGFKATPKDRENTPIKYRFDLTKSGWKFAGLDNINE